jgi:hypothetical protein
MGGAAAGMIGSVHLEPLGERAPARIVVIDELGIFHQVAAGPVVKERNPTRGRSGAGRS